MWDTGRREKYDAVETVVTHVACRLVRLGAATTGDVSRLMRLYGVDASRRDEVELELRRTGLGLKRASVVAERPGFQPHVSAEETELMRCAFTRSPSRRAAVRFLVRRAKAAWKGVLEELFRHREARRIALQEGRTILEQRHDEAPAPLREEDLAFIAALEEVQLEFDDYRERIEEALAGEQAEKDPGTASTDEANAKPRTDRPAPVAREPKEGACTDGESVARAAATLTTYARPRMVVVAWQAARRTSDPTLSAPGWLAKIGRRVAEFETERELLAHAFEGLVLVLVHRMPEEMRDDAETIIAGKDGIRKAIEYFDADADYEFQTYALHWVRRELGRRLTGPPTPRLRETLVELREELAREPSPTELAWATGAPLGEVCRLLCPRGGQADERC